MKKFKLIVPSFIAIIFCMLLIAGSTFALFTSEAKADISVTSGKVQISAELADLEVYSADSSLTTGTLAGIIADGNHAGTYYFKAQTVNEEKTSGTFANSGTATIANNKLTLNRVTPGDKVALKLNVVNGSNVNIKYRLIVECTDGVTLFSAMKFNVGTEDLTRVKKYVSAWTNANFTETTFGISLELPLETDNTYQDLATSLSFTVQAVQGNAAVSTEVIKDIVEFVTSAKSVTVSENEQGKKLAEQVKFTAVENEAEVNEKTTEVEFADGWYESTSKDDLNVVLSVETYEQDKALQSANNNNFVALVGETIVAGLDLNLSVNGETVSTFNDTRATVKSKIESGLSNVVVYYNGVALDDTDEGDNDCYSYNSTTGELIIKTSHFSEWYVTADMKLWSDFADTEWYTINPSSTEYTIFTAEQLAGFAKLINTNSHNFNNKTIKLGNDINLGNREWTPISSFTGTFDGQNHTIKGLTIIANQDYGNGFFSKFGYSGTAIMKNVTFDGAKVQRGKGTSGNVYGIIAGYAGYYGSVEFENVHVLNSTITGFGKVAAFAGMVETSGGHVYIKNCSVSSTTINSAYNGAGFIGLIHHQVSGTKNTVIIENSTVNVVSNSRGIGPIVSLEGYEGKYSLFGGQYYYADFALYYNEYNSPLCNDVMDAIVHNTPYNLIPEQE